MAAVRQNRPGELSEQEELGEVRDKTEGIELPLTEQSSLSLSKTPSRWLFEGKKLSRRWILASSVIRLKNFAPAVVLTRLSLLTSVSLGRSVDAHYNRSQLTSQAL